MSSDANWRASCSKEQRDRLVERITKVLLQAIVGEVAQEDSIRLSDAARQLENVLFQKCTSKEQYAQEIAQRIVNIKNKAKNSVAQSKSTSFNDVPKHDKIENSNISSLELETSTVTNTLETVAVSSPKPSNNIRKPSKIRDSVLDVLSIDSETQYRASTNAETKEESRIIEEEIKKQAEGEQIKSESEKLENNNNSIEKTVEDPSLLVGFTVGDTGYKSNSSVPSSFDNRGSYSVLIPSSPRDTLIRRKTFAAVEDQHVFEENEFDDINVEEEDKDDLKCGEGEIVIKFHLFKARLRLVCRQIANLADVKSQVWQVGEATGVLVTKKAKSEYIFRVDEDDYLIDETASLGSLPYIQFCIRNKIVPRFFVMEKTRYKYAIKQIGAVIGRPLAWLPEQGENDHFRKQMTIIRYTKYNNRSRIDTLVPSYLPNQFSVRVYVLANNQYYYKTTNCDATFTVADTTDFVFKSFGKFLEKELGKIPARKDYVLKLKGIEDYLLDGSLKLICIEAIRSKLRRKDKIELLLADRKQLPIRHWEKLTDFYEQNKIKIDKSDVGEIISDTIQSNSDQNCSLIWDETKPLRIKICKLDGLHASVLEQIGVKIQGKPVKIWVTASIYLVDLLIAEYKTDEFPYLGGNSPTWNQWIEGLPCRNLPWGSILHLVVWCKSSKKVQSVAWHNFQFTDYRDRFRYGFNSAILSSTKPDVSARKPPQDPDLKLSFEIQVIPTGLLFFARSFNATPIDTKHYPIPSSEEKEHLEKVFNADPLFIPSAEEKALLWKYRVYCFDKRPNFVAKFVWSIPWGNADAVKEAYSLLEYWPLLDEPANALELLKPRFINKKIRQYTIRNLQRLSDTELSDYLLQLIQAVKHEIHHDSLLARFLLHRALLNRNQIGHDFFWCLKAELQSKEFAERFEMLLEAYLRACGTFRDELVKQTSLSEEILTIANAIKSVKDDKQRKQIITQSLQAMKLPPYFQVTINPTYMSKGFLVDKCKYMQSKTVPLWLVLENVDPIGEPIHAIFKAGDDLRQDQLTLRMISIMDKMWLKEGLDLRMVNYKVYATGYEVGWVEVVMNSVTTADIQKEAGGVSEIFNEKTIAKWLRLKNPSDIEYKEAVDNFIRSSAGCAVATYVLGIGDRHNDNIMIDKSGHLFHIDFGKFLGNAEMFLNIRRDRAPFVFTPDMAYVMGGTESTDFQRFIDLCCKAYLIVRRNASIFINLFAMMLSTGIPTLTKEEDLNYLREAFALSISEEEARKKFTKLIFESLNTKAIQLNFAIHLLANPQ